MKTNSPMKAVFLGLSDYEETLELMDHLRDSRIDGKIGDHLLFLEHFPVITMGRRDSRDDLKVSHLLLKEKEINLLKTNRGGRITYHGPGQLVVYFVMDIARRRLAVDQFVCRTEEGIREFLARYGIEATLDRTNPGVFVKGGKIASVGFHLHRSVSSHGVALNLSVDLTPFSYFIPCGQREGKLTSLHLKTAQKPPLRDVAIQLAEIYGRLFGSSVATHHPTERRFSDEKGAKGLSRNNVSIFASHPGIIFDRSSIAKTSK